MTRNLHYIGLIAASLAATAIASATAWGGRARHYVTSALAIGFAHVVDAIAPKAEAIALQAPLLVAAKQFVTVQMQRRRTGSFRSGMWRMAV